MAFRSPKKYYQFRGNRITSAPAVEPVTLSEVKDQLRIDATETVDDTFLTQAIIDARQEIEDVTGLALITQSWLMTLDGWPSARDVWWNGTRQGAISDMHAWDGTVYLPRYPLQSVDSVTVYDTSGTGTVVDVAETFDVDTQQDYGRMALKSGATWPTATQSINAIEVGYTSGYGDASSDVPAPLKRAIRSMVAYLYAHRGDDCNMGDAYAASGAAQVAARYRVAHV